MNTKHGYGQLLTNEFIDGGRYRVDELIGTGGMGIVYAATQVSMKRDVAIKLLQAKLTEDEMMLKRFEQEALSVSRLRHPNIITIYDYGRTDDDRLFMVMERLHGDSLFSVLQARCLTSSESLRILSQVGSAIAEAHRRGVVHRDLKPENIHLETMGGEEQFVKVLDFGIAKIVHGDGQSPLDQPVTQAGVVFGTPHYMSPEQIHGHTIDHRSDIYALGVLLYELISGRLPFQGCSSVEAMLAQVSQPFPEVSLLQPDRAGISQLNALITDCTAKDPNDRIQSAEQFVERVDALLRTVADDLSVPSLQTDSVSATADTEYVSSEKEVTNIASESEPHDYNFTLTEADVDNHGGPAMTPAPFTGQLNPTGTEAALPGDKETRSWTLLLGAVAIVLAFWSLWQAQETENSQETNRAHAARPAQATQQTSYTLTSDPPGAQLFRDGVQVGVTPSTIVVSTPGTQRIRFQLEGHQIAERQLALSESRQAEIAVKLIPNRAWLRVDTEPSGAQVFIGELLVGVTPQDLKPRVSEGPLRIRLKLAGHKEAHETLDLVASGPSAQELLIKLEPKVDQRRRARSSVNKAKRLVKPQPVRVKGLKNKKGKRRKPESSVSDEGFDKL